MPIRSTKYATVRLRPNASPLVDYDAVILDIGLPQKDGFAVCRDLRAAGASVPVLMLTARHSVESRIAGLDSGADDYLTKPFAFGELLARLRAIARRRTPTVATDILTVGPLRVNTRTNDVTVDERRVILTAREYALLEYFCRRPGTVVSRQDIAQHVWDDAYDPLSNVIDVYIQRLRRKLGDDVGPLLIHTRRGRGYQLVPPADRA